MPLNMNLSETDSEKTNTLETNEQNEQINEKPEVIEVDRQLLLNLRTIFDIVSQRGSFKASEMSAVGKIYNDLNSLIE